MGEEQLLNPGRALAERLFRAFYAPTVLWVEHPALTLLPATLFALAYARSKRRGRPSRGIGVAALLWSAYSLYELAIALWSPRAALIRIDLIALGPLMYAVTVLGLVSCWRARSRVFGPDTRTVDPRRDR